MDEISHLTRLDKGAVFEADLWFLSEQLHQMRSHIKSFS